MHVAYVCECMCGYTCFRKAKETLDNQVKSKIIEIVGEETSPGAEGLDSFSSRTGTLVFAAAPRDAHTDKLKRIAGECCAGNIRIPNIKIFL